MTPELEAGFRASQAVARRAASNFACAFWMLPREQRRGMEALYAFARRSDDIADSHEPLDDRRIALARWRDQLRKALSGRSEDPVLTAVADTVSRFVVPQHLLWRILDGVEMDLNHEDFATYADLRRYCEHVASAVGLACLAIWGCRDDEAILPAADCGVAMQLTNILRDLQEDGRRQARQSAADNRHAGRHRSINTRAASKHLCARLSRTRFRSTTSGSRSRRARIAR
jgi:phytoene synthase